MGANPVQACCLNSCHLYEAVEPDRTPIRRDGVRRRDAHKTAGLLLWCWRRFKTAAPGVRRKSWTDLRRKSETFPVFRWAERPKGYLDSLFVVPVDI